MNAATSYGMCRLPIVLKENLFQQLLHLGWDIYIGMYFSWKTPGGSGGMSEALIGDICGLLEVLCWDWLDSWWRGMNSRGGAWSKFLIRNLALNIWKSRPWSIFLYWLFSSIMNSWKIICIMNSSKLSWFSSGHSSTLSLSFMVFPGICIPSKYFFLFVQTN